MSLMPLLLNFVLVILAKQQTNETNKQQTKTGIKVGKKLRLFAGDILHIKKSKEYSENLFMTSELQVKK